MKSRLCNVNADARLKLPPGFDDKSGIGAHYVDAYVKPMNTVLPDGTVVKCKRRGLRITLTIGAAKGDGLMRRVAVGPNPIAMLDSALHEAATAAGATLTIEDDSIYLSLPDKS